MIGRTLSHYRVLEELSRSGVGIVRRVLGLKPELEVAFEVLLQELASDPTVSFRRLGRCRAQPYANWDGDGEGIYVMGATGELVRRLTDFGHDPSWSPDGESILFTRWDGSRGPANSGGESELWSVKAATGSKN